jgi:hypothetical protein
MGDRILRYPLVTGLLVLLMISSCHKLIQDEFPDFTPVPTVNSFLIADSTIKFKFRWRQNWILCP